MAGSTNRKDLSQEIVALSIMKAVLNTEGVAEMVDTSVTTAFKVLIGSKSSLKGVRVQGQPNGLQIDVFCNVHYGTAIPQTAWSIQENVKAKVEALAEIPVRRVDVHIAGVVK
ncbi:MAG: Asp23/Gls24 family envelope stress response protein [Firmicutes bacterium]|nr:Asp23/Gls24 family envelope stress response protein [Bacillota bacterium]